MSQASSGNTNDDDEFFDEGSSSLLIPEDVMMAIDQVYINYCFIILSIIVPRYVLSVMTRIQNNYDKMYFLINTCSKNFNEGPI